MPIASDLLEILVCPETRQPLQVAPGELLTRLNQQIAEKKLRNRGGQPIAKPIREALVREDGHVLYVVDDGIPVMLVEESIEI
ncbi:MAG TPA: Trm112 family protein [Myxococcota bacterium]|nr:Trm112 family protein [Myxococcota bacterium]